MCGPVPGVSPLSVVWSALRASSLPQSFAAGTAYRQGKQHPCRDVVYMPPSVPGALPLSVVWSALRALARHGDVCEGLAGSPPDLRLGLLRYRLCEA